MRDPCEEAKGVEDSEEKESKNGQRKAIKDSITRVWFTEKAKDGNLVRCKHSKVNEDLRES